MFALPATRGGVEDHERPPRSSVCQLHGDFSLSPRTEADRRAGRVGGDPAAITKGNGEASTPYGAPPPEMAAAEQKKKGILGGLFGR